MCAGFMFACMQEAVSSASRMCVPDSTLDARMAELPAGSHAASPPASANLGEPDAAAPARAAAPGASPAAPPPVTTLTHSLLALSLDGLSSRAQSECSIATPAARHLDGDAVRRSPTLSPSGRYVAGVCEARHDGAHPGAEVCHACNWSLVV